jgi:hypothetical protein
MQNSEGNGFGDPWQILSSTFLKSSVFCYIELTLMESVGEPLKPVCQIAHTRHRSVYNASVHALAALAAYTWREHKPSLHLTDEEQALLAGEF